MHAHAFASPTGFPAAQHFLLALPFFLDVAVGSVLPQDGWSGDAGVCLREGGRGRDERQHGRNKNACAHAATHTIATVVGRRAHTIATFVVPARAVVPMAASGVILTLVLSKSGFLAELLP